MKKKRPSPFSKNYAPYGRYSGPRGNSNQWAQAFSERFTELEIKEILAEDNPWSILGLKVGATQGEIAAAFRVKAMETHPDRNPQLNGDTALFRKVKAAFDKLRS